MPQKNNQNRSQEWLNTLTASLKESELSGKTDIVIDYRSVSQSFPCGSHQDSFDIPLIDWDNFRTWANKKGWDVKSVPGSTHPDHKSTQKIRFTKINPQG